MKSIIKNVIICLLIISTIAPLNAAHRSTFARFCDRMHAIHARLQAVPDQAVIIPAQPPAAAPVPSFALLPASPHSPGASEHITLQATAYPVFHSGTGATGRTVVRRRVLARPVTAIVEPMTITEDSVVLFMRAVNEARHGLKAVVSRPFASVPTTAITDF